LHAREALGFDEFQVGIRILAEDAEPRLPIGVTALSLDGGGPDTAARTERRVRVTSRLYAGPMPDGK
jgi:hypothetical protein